MITIEDSWISILRTRGLELVENTISTLESRFDSATDLLFEVLSEVENNLDGEIS